MKIEVLVAAMHQDDLSLPGKMNITTDVIVGNQCDHCSDEESVMNGHNVRYFNRPDRGVGLNRNVALLHADAEILTFADADMIFQDDYASIISKAFEELPNADAIVFNIESLGAQTGRRVNHKVKRIRWYNALNYGAARISVRSLPIKRENILFHTCFGGGTRFNAGEDVLFIVDMLKHGLRLYTYPVCIAQVDQTSSTWFNGYDKKFFHDKGVLFAAISQKWHKLLCLQFLLRHRSTYQNSGISSKQAYRLMKKGAQSFRTLRAFSELSDDETEEV